MHEGHLDQRQRGRDRRLLQRLEAWENLRLSDAECFTCRGGRCRCAKAGLANHPSSALHLSWPGPASGVEPSWRVARQAHRQRRRRVLARQSMAIFSAIRPPLDSADSRRGDGECRHRTWEPCTEAACPPDATEERSEPMRSRGRDEIQRATREPSALTRSKRRLRGGACLRRSRVLRFGSMASNVVSISALPSSVTCPNR